MFECDETQTCRFKAGSLTTAGVVKNIWEGKVYVMFWSRERVLFCFEDLKSVFDGSA